MNRSAVFALILVAVAALIASMSLYTVKENELAIKIRLGEFTAAEAPGLYVKIPLLDRVEKFDKRIQTLDMEPSRYLTFEKKNVIVDAFVKWRIKDVSLFRQTTLGDIRNANQRLNQVVVEGLRNEIGKRTIQEAIAGERAEIMNVITDQFKDQASQFGIQVVDVRLKRIELPPEVSSSVFQRMEAERSKVAKDLRSRGSETAEGIKADADRQRTVILAEAYRDAERTRGEGDAKASEIYAGAFRKNEEFYRLYRSLDAYKKVFTKPQDVLVIDPNSEFFKYFNSSSGR